MQARDRMHKWKSVAFFLACLLQQELYLYVYALFVTGGSTLQIQPNGIYT